MRRHGGDHEEGEFTGEIDPQLLAHAVIMSLWVIGAGSFAIWSGRTRKQLHLRWMGVLGTVLLAAMAHAFWFVEAPPGDHSETHSILAWIILLAIGLQYIAAAFRTRPSLRAVHVWLGRGLCFFVFPLQFWTGISVACNDASTALVGHLSTALFTQLLGTVMIFNPQSSSIEPLFMLLGGGAGLLGDLAVTPGGFDPKRIQHLYLYTTFIVAGCFQYVFRGKAPVVTALSTMGLMMLVHQHGHSHQIVVEGAMEEMGSAGAGLTMAVHAASGIAMLAAAALRFFEKMVEAGAALIIFSIVFTASQPEVCECWVVRTGLPPAIYGGLGVQLAVYVAAVTIAATRRTASIPVFRYTTTSLKISESDSEGSE